MSKKESFYYHLGFLWCLPVSMIFWVIYGILFLLGQIENVYLSKDLILTWDIHNERWFAKKFFIKRGWVGFSAGNNILIMDVNNAKRWIRTLKHERTHTMQQYKYGILWIVLYLLDSARIYLFEKDLHCYLDNCFEIEARSRAGQPVKIPREQWPNGPDDRNPWW